MSQNNEYYTKYNFDNVFNRSYNYLGIYDSNSHYSQKFIDKTSSFIYLDSCKYCSSIADENDESNRMSGYWAIQVTAGFIRFDNIRYIISNFEDTIDPNKKYTVFGYACGRRHLNYILLAAANVIQNMYIQYNAKYNCITIVANRITREDYAMYRHTNNVVNGAFGFPFPKAYTGIYDARNIMSQKFIDNDFDRYINSYKHKGCMLTLYSDHSIPFIDLCIAKYSYNPSIYKKEPLIGQYDLGSMFYTFSSIANSMFKIKSCQSLAFLPSFN